MENIKCVCIGDGAVGKTSMLISYTSKQFPVDYVPTTFDTYRANCIVNSRPVSLGLWDTAGQEDYDIIRPISYADTDVFVICYSVNAPASLQNILQKWAPEIRDYCPKAPFVLLGTKVDMRKDLGESAGPLTPGKQADPLESSFVYPDEAERVGKELGAARIMECSSRTPGSLEGVFQEVARIGFESKFPSSKKGNRRKQRRGKCTLL